MSDQNEVPPALMLRQLAFVMRASRALYAGAQLGVADILASGPMTSGEIAAKAGTDAPTLRRLLRALVAHGVFEEEAPDLFRLNSAGELLRSDGVDVLSLLGRGLEFARTPEIPRPAPPTFTPIARGGRNAWMRF